MQLGNLPGLVCASSTKDNKDSQPEKPDRWMKHAAMCDLRVGSTSQRTIAVYMLARLVIDFERCAVLVTSRASPAPPLVKGWIRQTRGLRPTVKAVRNVTYGMTARFVPYVAQLSSAQLDSTQWIAAPW